MASQSDGRPSSPILQRIQGLAQEAEEAGQAQLFDRQAERLRALLGSVRENREALMPDAPAVGRILDQAAFDLYRLSLGNEAREAVEEALRFAPDLPSALQHKAVILLSMNLEVDKVLGLLDRALTLDPRDKSIWASRGDALKILGRPQEAVESYLHAQQLEPSSTLYVDRALKLVPGHPKALRLKLAVALSLGNAKVATDLADQLLQGSPNDPELHFIRAQIHQAGKEPEKALVEAGRAAELLPGEPRYRFLQARLLLDLGRFPEAAPIVKELLEQGSPLDPVALQQVAGTLEGSPSESGLALEVRRRVMSLDPRNLANLQSLRDLGLRLDRKDVAIEACRALLAVSPGNLDAEKMLGTLLAETGQVDPALKVYQEIAHLHPSETDEIRKGLRLAQENRRWAVEVVLARAVLAQVPGDPPALRDLAEGLGATAQREEALRIYDDLLSRNPDDVALLLQKKGLLQALGKVDQIPAILDRIFEKDPSKYDVALERGNLALSRAYRTPEGSPERSHWITEALRSYERSSLSDELRNPSSLGTARAAKLLQDLPRAVENFRAFLADPANAARGDIYKELGHTLREAGNLSEAEAAYSRAVELGREEADLLWGLAETLLALGQDARALGYLDQLLQKDPRNPLYLRRRGRVLLKMGRPTEGVQALKATLSAGERDPQAYWEVAEALKEMGAYQDALGYFQRGLQLNPKDKHATLEFCETLLRAGRPNDAAAYLDPLIRQDTRDPAAWRLRAQIYKALERDTEVLYSLRAILLLEPNDAGAWREKYRLHVARGEKVDAFETLSSLLENPGASSDSGELWLEHGDLAAELGKVEVALESYDRAVRTKPGLAPEVAYRKALALSRLQRFREALAAMEALGTPPFPPSMGEDLAFRASTLRGSIHFNLEEFDKSLQIFEALVKARPSDRTVAIWYARTLLALGRHATARDFLREVLPNLTGSPSAYLYLAEAEAGAGSLELAVEVCDHGLGIHSTSLPLLLRRAELETRLERWKEAADAYSRALAIEANDPQLYLRAGEVREKLGHIHEALSAYDRAVQIDPLLKEAHVQRGRMLLALDQPEKAAEAFDHALKLDPAFEAAREGKRQSQEKERDLRIQALGKEALLLEAKLNRPITKNDLFMTLHVPFDLLDAVTRSVGRTPDVHVPDLNEGEMEELEDLSYHLILAALDQRADALEKKGLSLSDVAALSPPGTTLAQMQKVFGYMRAVLKMDLRPENLSLTPEMEDLARQALSLPSSERTLFRLVRNLRVGIYKARVLKAVESLGGMEALGESPTIPLSENPPDTRVPPEPRRPPSGTSSAEPALAEEEAPDSRASGSPPDWAEASPPEGSAGELPRPTPRTTPDGLTTAPEGFRCQSCGGVAQYLHRCGATICHSCIVQYHTCPRCSLPLSPPEPGWFQAAPPEPTKTSGRRIQSPGLQRVRLPKPRDEARL